MADLRVAILPVTPFQQNCTFVWCAATERCAVVDPGGDVPTIRRVIDEHQAKVEKIVLTHGHIDHAGGAAELAEALAVPIEGPHRDDRFLLDGLEQQGREYGLVGARAVTPDRWLDEGDTVTIGELVFAVYHCPGHTPGHIVLFNEAARFALVGDVLFRGSIGRTDLPGGNHDALIRSIREKLFPLGDDISFICGHGPGSTFGEERRTNPFVGDHSGTYAGR